MEKIDSLIKETLNSEEAKFYDELEEQNLLGKIGQANRGKMGWLVNIMTFLSFAIFGVFVYCAIQFFDVNETFGQIKWATAGIICLLMLCMMKLYIWMQMDKNDILRELKRIELQIANLSNK